MIPSNKISNEDYYKNFLIGDCQYNKDLKWASDIAIKYLNSIAPKYKTNGRVGYVIFDFDDTIVFNDSDQVLGFKDMELGYIDNEPIFLMIRNPSIVQILEVAKKLGFKILILTARPLASYKATVINLKAFNIPFHSVIMNKQDKDPYFKVKVRKDLLKQNPKADIVLTCGDMITDVFMPGTGMGIKLPDIDSKCSYICPPN